MKKVVIRILLIGILSICINSYVKAQGDPGDPGDDPDRIPLDPGSWVLVAAGVGYGVSKWRNTKQQAQKNYPVTTGDLMREENETDKNCL